MTDDNFSPREDEIEKLGGKGATLMMFDRDPYKSVLPFTPILVEGDEIVTPNHERILDQINSLEIDLIARSSSEWDYGGNVDVLETKTFKRPIQTEDILWMARDALSDRVRRYAKHFDQIDNYDGLRSVIIQPDVTEQVLESRGFFASYIPHPSYNGVIVITYGLRNDQFSWQEYLFDGEKIVSEISIAEKGLIRSTEQYLANNRGALMNGLFEQERSVQREIILSRFPWGTGNEDISGAFEHGENQDGRKFAERLFYAQQRDFRPFDFHDEVPAVFPRGRVEYGRKPEDLDRFRNITLNDIRVPEEDFVLILGSLEAGDSRYFLNYFDSDNEAAKVGEMVNSPYLRGIGFERDLGEGNNGNLSHGSYRFLMKSPYSYAFDKYY